LVECQQLAVHPLQRLARVGPEPLAQLAPVALEALECGTCIPHE
jgi:hypothetical protein